MWPCRVGPFSVVLGKHTRSFNTADLPFSHLEADAAGRCELIPGPLHRHGRHAPRRRQMAATRSPQRARRCATSCASKCSVRSPSAECCAAPPGWHSCKNRSTASVSTVNVGGVEIKRVLLRMGVKRYTAAVERYLLEQIFNRLEQRLDRGEAFAAARSSPRPRTPCTATTGSTSAGS